MTTTKKTILVLALILLIPISMSFAGPMHGQDRYGYGHMGYQGDQLAPEKQAQWNKIMDAHYKEIQPLRDALWQKQMELDALAVNPNTKPEDIRALTNEMVSIRKELDAKRDAMQAKIRQDVGIDMPARGWCAGGGCAGQGGRGMGRGMHGYGGHGMHGSGMGY
ncbi:hypothetical protein MASR1M90_05810 [Desulfovibrionales bacterium]